MEVKDILKTKHTVQEHHTDYASAEFKQYTLDLDTIINKLPLAFKDQIDLVRSFEYHSDDQKAAKKECPIWLVGGVFRYKEVKNSAIFTYSNIIAIDIDGQDNEGIDLDKIKQNIFALPYVFYISQSISNHGFYALILVEDGSKTNDYTIYLADLFKQKFNVNVDRNSKGLARKRYVSYDENAMLKPLDAEIKPWWLTPLPKQEPKENKKKVVDQDDDIKTELTRKAIWMMLDTGYTVQSRSAWYYVGVEFANFNDGYEMFKKLCENYGDQHESIDNKWDECVKKADGLTDDIHIKWQGMAKNNFGEKWWKQYNLFH